MYRISLNTQQPKEWMVGWSLMALVSTNMAISQTKGQGWRAIPTQ